MKKLLFVVRYVRPIVSLCLVVGVLFFSCTPDENDISPKKEVIADDLIQFLEGSGFNKEDIVLKDGIFIIEDDILISKEEVEAYIALREPSHGRNQHWRGTYLVSDSYVTNIKFYINSSVSASWATAIRGAISQWNAVNGTKLFMSEVTSSSSANTVINTSYSSQNWVARAYLPSSNRRPGHTMTINTKYNSMNSSRKLFTIVHEMGHIFGLYHTDERLGTFINGTPATDPNSVMNSFVLPWNGFTSGDIAAVQIIYPD